MAKSLAAWNPLGKAAIDLDNKSFDCVDIPKSWAEYLTDKPWQTSFCWGNAKDLYANCPTTYWTKISRGSQDPKPGDVVVMSGAIGGGYGHTGVVIEVIGNNIKIVQQNTFTQQPPYTGVYDKNASYIIGYLRPKVAFTVGVEQALAKYARILGGDVTFYRQAPARSAALMITDTIKDGKLQPGETYDFKGFVRGESVDGNNIWFVGMYSSGYAWSGGFTDTGTHDLADLTPAPALQPTQRQIGSDAMNYRRTPNVAPDNVIRLISAGETLTMDGWIQGQVVDGNNVWFRTNGGYIWSGGFVDKGTHDLPQIATDVVTPPTTTPPVVTPPVVTPPAEQPYTFQADLACVTQVKPAGIGSFEHGNFPASPEKIVIHDFGTKGVDKLSTVIPWFQKKDNISAHFAVEGKEIVQFVKLGDRAYHAGPNGNMYIGIETSPYQDADTIASTNTLIHALELFYNKKFELIKHSSIMQTNCGDDIDMANYHSDGPGTSTPTGLEARVKALEDWRDKVLQFFKNQ